MKVFDREISIRKKKEKESMPSAALQHVSEKAFAEYVEGVKAETGKSEAVIIEEIFRDGWLTFMVEESGGVAKIEASQLFKEKGKEVNRLNEYVRLRENFAPISTCIDYLIDQLVGGGVCVVIKKADDQTQKKFKEELEKLSVDIYQDEYTRSLRILLPILVNDALTMGCAAAEIAYEGNKNFWDFARVSEDKKVIKINGKDTEIVIYDTKEPNWTKDLKGIMRLKIMDNAYRRFNPQRDPKSWEVKYWILDEGKEIKPITLSSGITVRQTLQTTKVAGTYFHPWQLFWLILKRKGYGVKGVSVIAPVYSMAVLLEKIYKAVGEGIHRAGNKKYFIVCGTKERPWSGPHIRNVLQQLKEAQKKNWSTIPMPEGFDIKDIGGDVFEAKDVVAYFLKTIASGLRVPSSVLGIEVKEQKDWSHDELRSNLELAVKHQLFKRHIWCLHGQTKTKQGGKGTTVTYIPDIRFKIEELLTMQQQLDLYKTMLNPANPVRPEVKLEVERGICRLMGWDTVLLPTQEEYKRQLDEEKKLMDQKMQTKVPFGEKAQGAPEPQTSERQKKRLEGMTKKHEDKGKAKEMGGTRMPKEVQETVPEPLERVPIEIKLTQPQPTGEKIIREVITPVDEIMIELATERKKLLQKQQDKEDLETKLMTEENKKRREKLQNDIVKTTTEIEKLKIEVEATHKIIEAANKKKEKFETETEEIKRTHEEKRKAIEAEKTTKEKLLEEESKEKRKVIEKIKEKISDEEEFIDDANKKDGE